MMSMAATHGSGHTDVARLNDLSYSDTFWDDIANSLIGRQLASAAGKVGYDWDENTLVMSPGGDINVANDRINFNIQLSHKTKPATKLLLHTHWRQTAATPVEFTVQYRIQNHGATTTTDWQTVVVDAVADGAFPYVSGSLNQATGLVDIDLTGAGLSAVVQIRMVRSDAEAGDIHVLFIDAHYEIDTPGSREPYQK